MAAFWTHLQQDEQRHAGWVADLTPMAETGQLQAEERHASPEVYQGFSEYLYDETHRARKHPLTTARFVERSYLEKHLMEIFATDTGELRRLMQTLITDTERHAQVIETALKELEKTTG